MVERVDYYSDEEFEHAQYMELEYLREKLEEDEMFRHEQFCLNNNICPRCESELTIHKWQEDREYMGMPVKEEFIEKYCSVCSYECKNI